MESTGVQRAFLSQLDPSEQIFSLFDFMPGVSFFVKDRRGRFVMLNQRGCEYCGVTDQNAAIGKTDHDFFPKQRADEYQADDRAVMDAGEPIVGRMESAPEAEGSPRLVMTTKVPLRNRKGKVIGIAGFSYQVEQMRERSGTAAAFENVIESLHKDFAKPLTTESLAKTSGLSVSQFERRFRRAFGASPRQYLMRIRVENAARMLREGDASISDIALQCGFYDHSHFNRTFKRIMNTSPSQYRR
ncbi:helix-turn-helix domain-containing protein [Rubripirellula amarantea]|nr:helix-turn-helix domain-containing protein [Rubripirellula amarantea]